MFVGVALMLFFFTSLLAVEFITQFPECVDCTSLSFRDDAVYIGEFGCIIHWNVVTDAVVRLEEYSSLF